MKQANFDIEFIKCMTISYKIQTQLGGSSMNIFALDDGYGDVKYDSDGNPKLIPSFVTSFKPKPTTDFALNHPSEENQKYIASQVNNKKYIVGNYASKLDPNIQWVGGENKHKDQRFPILFKSTLGLMCQRPIDTIDLLAMNLPIDSNTEERKNLLRQVALGNHKVDISFDGVNFYKKDILVKDLIIKPQAFGSLCTLILNQRGEMTNVEKANGFNVIVDIGARTVNILTVDQLEEVPDLTTHTNEGMFQAYYIVLDYLRHEKGIDVPDGKLPQIIQKKSIKNYDLSPLIDEAYRTHANNIISMLDRMFVNVYGFITSVTFTGGSKLLERYLREEFDKRNFETTYLNRFANVRGLRLYALNHAAKNPPKKNVSVRIGR